MLELVGFHQYAMLPYTDTKTPENCVLSDFFTSFRHHIRCGCQFFLLLQGHTLQALQESTTLIFIFLYVEDNLFQILKTEISGSLTAVYIRLSIVASLSK